MSSSNAWTRVTNGVSQIECLNHSFSAWRVADEIAETINGAAPSLGEFIEAQLTPREDCIFSLSTVYVKEY